MEEPVIRPFERPTDVLREAFLGVVSDIEGSIEAPVLRGSTA